MTTLQSNDPALHTESELICRDRLLADGMTVQNVYLDLAWVVGEWQRGRPIIDSMRQDFAVQTRASLAGAFRLVLKTSLAVAYFDAATIAEAQKAFDQIVQERHGLNNL